MRNPSALEDPDMTLREARAALYLRCDFPTDGGVNARSWSPLRSTKLKAHLPNFEWRRAALPLHDLHHVITGYDFSPRGEFEMAAWEFAAGRYPNAMSTAFCLPLVCLGAMLEPRRTFSAFVRGRRSRTLYSAPNVNALLDRPLREVRCQLLPGERPQVTVMDRCAFVALTVAASFVLSSPVSILCLGWFLWR
jgi:hypothetical protein